MSKKLIIGLAAVGGGLYYYDQNIHPVFPRNEKAQKVAARATEPSLTINKDLRKLDSKARDFGSQLKKTAHDSADEVKLRTDTAVNAVKDSDVYNTWSKKIDNYSKDVELAAEEVDKKPLPLRLAAKYIDAVNRVGQTDEEKLRELASSNTGRQQELKKDLSESRQSWSSWWSGKKSEADEKADELHRKAEKKKDGWLNWGLSKKQEANQKYEEVKSDAEKEKNSWLSWGSAKKDEANKKYEQAKADAEKEKNSWTNWGSAKADEADLKLKGAKNDLSSTYEQQKKEWSDSYESGKKTAVDEYHRAKKTLDDLTKQASDKAHELFGQAKVDQDNHLKKAKNDFQSALTNLRKYGGDLVDHARGEK